MNAEHISPCMGGFCDKRDRCAHYCEPSNKWRPAERLCDKGAEKVMFFLRSMPKQSEAT